MDEVRNVKTNLSGLLVASKQLNPGDVVFSVPPLAAGPGKGCHPVCLGCHKIPPTGLAACEGCSWPVCSASCKTYHCSQECGILKTIACDSKQFTSASHDFDFVHPLRLILQMQSRPEVAKSLKNLNIDIKRLLQKVKGKYDVGSENICEQLKKLKLTVTKEDVDLALCVIERFDVPLDFGASAVSVEACQLEHSCSPNTYYIGSNDSWVVFRAGRIIKEGEVITTCCVAMDKNNYFRQKLLKEACVSCSCSRCTDGTEFGTGHGSVCCSRGCNGFVSPGTDCNADWICSACGASKPAADCRAILDRLKQKLEDAAKNPKVGTADFYEKVLEQKDDDWSLVPSSSQLMMDARKALIYTYQYHPQFYFPEEDWLHKKIGHCKAWLQVADKIMPGWSYIKTLIMYEHASATISLVQAMKAAGRDRAEVNQVCYAAVELCSEPVDMMVLEEDQSMCKAFNAIKLMATEAREEQKQRVYINRFADDDDEGW